MDQSKIVNVASTGEARGHSFESDAASVDFFTDKFSRLNNSEDRIRFVENLDPIEMRDLLIYLAESDDCISNSDWFHGWIDMQGGE